MALKYGWRKLSLNVLGGDVLIGDENLLYRSIPDPIRETDESALAVDKLNNRKKGRRTRQE